MRSLLISLLACSMFACQNQEADTATPGSKDSSDSSFVAGTHPEWSRQASIYEVNIRQHTPQGSFEALRRKLPEMKNLGVKILWLMPVQPVGVEQREGEMGNPYAIRNHTTIDPAYGSMEDFKALVTAAHDLGFKVILDWVAGYTASDHSWASQHPDWYKDKRAAEAPGMEGMVPLNYQSDSLRLAMQEAMMFWVKNTGIDGFHCSMAPSVPLSFWKETRLKLDSLKPMFMLVQAEGPEYHDTAFDMTYASRLYQLMNEVANGKENLAAIDQYLAKQDSLFPADALHMYFITNHKENSQNGTVRERLGDNARNFFVLTATLPNGMPLVYSGQEFGNTKRLALYDKDTISATDSSLFDWYAKIIKLKMDHPVLVNFGNEASFIRHQTPPQDSLYAYTRAVEKEGLLVVLNFSHSPQSFELDGLNLPATLTDALSGEDLDLGDKKILLPAHGHKLIVFEK